MSFKHKPAILVLGALLCMVGSGSHAASSFCRSRSSLPPGNYQQTCRCAVEHCDYLVCTCDGQYHSTFKITACTSQSFSDRNGMLACN